MVKAVQSLRDAEKPARSRNAESKDAEKLSHNLLGQRLGRKGRDTRERIIAAAQRLLAGPADNAFSLSAVAREASLGMTTLYLYFSDLSELLIAVLEPIMDSAERSYLAYLRVRWPDETLSEHCTQFIEIYCEFWKRHSRALHLRNTYVEGGDERLREHRIGVSRPLIGLLAQQMNGDPDKPLSPAYGMATALITSIERIVTAITDVRFSTLIAEPEAQVRSLMWAEARLLELGIRDCRVTMHERR